LRAGLEAELEAAASLPIGQPENLPGLRPGALPVNC
jgi:hypothetical protein